MAAVFAYDASHHTGIVSRAGKCAQGGQDTCSAAAEFSVLSDDERGFNMAACAQHVAGAIRDANGTPRRAPRRR
jgi:hypothetical protein